MELIVVPRPPKTEIRTSAEEFNRWLVRSGLASESRLAMNRAGLYTDFV